MNLHDRTHWSHFKTRNVTVSVTPRSHPRSAVFMVKSVIDNGRGRRRAVLGDPEHLVFDLEYLMDPQRIIPAKLGPLDLIYTGRFAMHVPYLHKALAESYKNAKVERIVPDILEPGDFIVFQRSTRARPPRLEEVLRVMTEKKTRKYALQLTGPVSR